MNASIVRKPRIVLAGGQVTTTSLAIAEHFSKSHFNVMRDIKGVVTQLRATGSEFNFEFAESNFRLDSYRDGQGKERPMYRLTRDAFVLVVMGFTGAEALQWKIAYINTFNLMEQRLMSRSAHPVPLAQPGCDRNDYVQGPVFNELYRLFDFQRGAASLMTYLLAQEAYIKRLCKSIRDIESEMNGTLSRHGVTLAARKLVDRGVLDCDFGGRNGRGSYLVRIQELRQAFIEQALNEEVLPLPDERPLLH